MLSLRFAYDYTPFYFMSHIHNEVIKNYDDGKRQFFFSLVSFLLSKQTKARHFVLMCLFANKGRKKYALSRPPTGMSQSPYHILC